jgi:hypothetical protein
MRRGATRLFAACVISMVALPGVSAIANAAERYVVIVSGAAGSPEIAEQHATWRTALVTSLQDKLQMPAERLIVLIDKSTTPSASSARPATPGAPTGVSATAINPPSGRPGGTSTQGSGGQGGSGSGRPNAAGGLGAPGAPVVAGAGGAAAAASAAADAARAAEIDKRAIAATRDNVRATLTKLAQDMKREDVALIVLFGHSTFDGVDAKFNLVGPDLEATEWERLVNALPGRVVFVNTTAASAPFMKRLASNGRVVITATDNPAQRYQTVFPEFFSQAFEAADVDLDKDGRVSIWEAFAYASQQVKQYYRQRGQLSVERPVLDDTGDGVGKESGEPGSDGSIASRTFLDNSDDPGTGTGPALSELINRRNTLEADFDDLKRKRTFMPAGDYEKQRDQLLIEISRISHEIRLEQRKRS